MMTSKIHDTRVSRLNSKATRRGKYVLYWMQQSQRVEFNHALEYAVQRANALDQPLLACFGLMDDYPEANLRHYTFMLQGLRDTQEQLLRRGIKLALQRGRPDVVALRLGANASLVVCDCGYLRHQKYWRRHMAGKATCEIVQVEADVVVPVEAASDKAEVGARTLRPRLGRQLSDHLVGLRPTRLRHSSLGLQVQGLSLDDIDSVLAGLKIERGVRPVSTFIGGATEAKRRLGRFIRTQLKGYSTNRSRLELDCASHMSLYLHFGQISPLYVALQIKSAAEASEEDRAAFLEELIVRRELAHNFVHFTRDYDKFKCVPAWARATLSKHRDDRRERQYTKAQLEAGATHDIYWNAAMREMKYTGYMHNYMRMYWGKKILEWSRTPQYAYRLIMELNNRYFIDGRDPNSYANVAWVFGMHDRPWPERPIFGNVRSMTESGLERKANPQQYVERVDTLLQKMGVDPES